MTDEEIIGYVQAHIGGEKKTKIVKPLILAMAELAYKDLAMFLIESNSEFANKLITSAVNQTWSSSQFTAPSNMLFHRQIETTRIDFNGTLAHQVSDRDALDMAGTLSNIYYALEGKTFYIKNPSATSGSTLNIRYYKIPENSDIDDELRNTFLEILMQRLYGQKQADNKNSKTGVK